MLVRKVWEKKVNFLFLVFILFAAVIDGTAIANSHAVGKSSTWHFLPTPSVNGTGAINAISAYSSSDAFAVGYYLDHQMNPAPLVLDWNGSKWNAVSHLPSTGNSGFEAVAELSPQNVWAFGFKNTLTISTELIEHWDGKTWSQVPSLTQVRTGASRVSAISATDIWVIGGGMNATSGGGNQAIPVMEHWNGKIWSIVPIHFPVNSYHTQVDNLSALSAKNVWVVGSYDTDYRTPTSSLVEHYDGKKWTLFPTFNTLHRSVAIAILTISTNDIWTIGSGVSGNPVPSPEIEHWNGKDWTLIPDSGTGQATAVAASSSQDIWVAGGNNGTNNNNLFLMHWDGKTWTQISNAISVSPGGAAFLTSITHIPGSTSFFAAGFVTDANQGLLPVIEEYS